MTPDELKAAREKLGMTQIELEQFVKLKPNGGRTVCRWESDKDKWNISGLHEEKVINAIVAREIDSLLQDFVAQYENKLSNKQKADLENIRSIIKENFID